jgi:hypothetical protein
MLYCARQVRAAAFEARQPSLFPGADPSERGAQAGQYTLAAPATGRITTCERHRFTGGRHEGIGWNRGKASWSCRFTPRGSSAPHGGSASEGGATNISEEARNAGEGQEAGDGESCVATARKASGEAPVVVAHQGRRARQAGRQAGASRNPIAGTSPCPGGEAGVSPGAGRPEAGGTAQATAGAPTCRRAGTRSCPIAAAAASSPGRSTTHDA